MLPRCQQDGPMMLLVAKKQIFCTMLPRCLQDANMMYILKLCILLHYLSFITMSLSTMLPQCSQDAYTMYKEHYSTSMHIWIVLVGVKHYQQPTKLA